MRVMSSLGFLLILLCMVLAPALALLPLPTVNPLAGTSLQGVTAAVTLPEDYLSGFGQSQLQKPLEQAVAQRLGQARDLYIRYANYADYIMGRSANPAIKIGLNQEIYTREHLRDYCIRADVADLEHLAASIRDASERLRSMGKAFVFVLSPNKAALQPENLPLYCRPPNVERTADRLVDLLVSSGVAVLNSEDVLAAELGRGTPRIFGQFGQHWNDVGQFYTTTAIVDMVEQQLQRHIGDLVVTRQWTDQSPVRDEADTGLLMNLPIPLNPASPHLDWTANLDRPLKNVIFVGTSFLDRLVIGLASSGIADHIVLYNYFKWRFDLVAGSSQMAPVANIDATQDLQNTLAAAEAVVLEAQAASITSGHLLAFTNAVLALLM